MKCQCCHEQQASYAWQPFGPGKDVNTQFTLPGNHYRGFPVIKVCLSCKSAFETGDFPVKFTYKHFNYTGQNHEVREDNPSFYDGGTGDLYGENATIVMRDMPDDDVLVAMVTDPAMVALFVEAPHFLDACRKIAQAFPSYDGLSREQSLALASVNVALQALDKQSMDKSA